MVHLDFICSLDVCCVKGGGRMKCYVHVTPVRCTVVQVMSSICSPQEAGYVLTYTAAGLVRI